MSSVLVTGAGGSIDLRTEDGGTVETTAIPLSALLAALSFNVVSGPATIVAAHAAGYDAVTAPAITRKGSGRFLILSQCNISVNGGTLADGDAVTYSIHRDVGNITLDEPLAQTGAVTATGGETVVALASIVTFDDASGSVAVGATATYSLRVTGSNGHTSGVTATDDGTIIVVEL